jgi:tetratricopeptide (TPR) repeat protein
MRALLVLWLLAAAGPALASAEVDAVPGSEAARRCFAAAMAPVAPRKGRRACDSALRDEALSMAARAATLVNRGILQMQARNLKAALADYDAAIALNPGSADAHVNKGLALLHDDQDDEAVTQLTIGIDLGPTRPEVAHYARAVAQESRGRLREAYNDYGRARALAPTWDEPVRQLARFRIVRRKTMSA